MKTILAKLSHTGEVEVYQVCITPVQTKRLTEAYLASWGESFRQYTPREFKKVCTDKQRQEYNEQYAYLKADKIVYGGRDIPEKVGVFMGRKLVSKVFTGVGSESHIVSAYKFASNAQRGCIKKLRVVAINERSRRLGYA